MTANYMYSIPFFLPYHIPAPVPTPLSTHAVQKPTCAPTHQPTAPPAVAPMNANIVESFTARPRQVVGTAFFTTTTPPFITSVGFSRIAMFCSGSPSTATRSA